MGISRFWCKQIHSVQLFCLPFLKYLSVILWENIIESGCTKVFNIMDCIRRGTWNVPEVENSPIYIYIHVYTCIYIYHRCTCKLNNFHMQRLFNSNNDVKSKTHVQSIMTPDRSYCIEIVLS